MQRSFASCWCALALTLAGCTSTPSGRNGSIAVGALLPFTGERAASGANVERALLLAIESINAHMPPGLQRLKLVSRDTGGDISVGIDAALRLFNDDGVTLVVGPLEPDLSVRVAPLVQAADGLQMLPGEVPPVFDALRRSRWFRVGTTPKLLGCALGKRIAHEGNTKPVLFFNSDEYSRSFADFVTRGLPESSAVRASLPFQEDDTTFRPLLDRAASFAPDSLVLIGYPGTGARLIRDSLALPQRFRWYFSSSLDSEAFTSNVPPSTVEGMMGVSSIPIHSAEFREVYRARWYGAEPLADAFVAYDAMLVIGLALVSAQAQLGPGQPPALTVSEHVSHVATAPGEPVLWSDIGRAVELLAQGVEIDLEGVSSDLNFDATGAVSSPLIQYWSIQEGVIVREEPIEVSTLGCRLMQGAGNAADTFPQ